MLLVCWCVWLLLVVWWLVVCGPGVAERRRVARENAYVLEMIREFGGGVPFRDAPKGACLSRNFFPVA